MGKGLKFAKKHINTYEESVITKLNKKKTRKQWAKNVRSH